MQKRGKGKGPRAAKVPKATKERVTRSRIGDNHPQPTGRSEPEGGHSSGIIGRKDVPLVVGEVLKMLEQRDSVPSGPNWSSSTLPQGMTSTPVAMSSRSQNIGDLHLPGWLFV